MKVLFVSSVSACLEIENEKAYYAPEPFEVFVNGQNMGRKMTNVFSLFNLTPDTMYEVKVNNESVSFSTKPESCCIDVCKNGATGNGKTDDTVAIQTCIDACKKGGRVRVPKGVYCCGPLFMRSNVTLELCKDAVLLGIKNRRRYMHYPAVIRTENDREIPLMTWEGNLLPSRGAFINAYQANDFCIVGEGTIDANAKKAGWWKRRIIKNGKHKGLGRPRLAFFNACQNVVLHGVTAQNSPSWTMHPFFCKNVGFYDVQVLAPEISPNTDGINPECCQGVNITGCKISTGDDCIALKSGKMHVGMQYQTPAKDTVIRNCLMCDGHGAIVLGSEISGGVQNLQVSQCVFRGTDRGLRIKTRRGRGQYSVVDDITFSNIVMQEVKTPLVINMYYNCDSDGNTEYVWSREALPIDDRTPYLGEFTFDNIVCTDMEYIAGYFDGLVEQPIKKITLKNLVFTAKEDAEEGSPALQTQRQVFKRAGLYFDNVKEVVVKNVQMQNIDGEDLILKKCDNITID